MKLLIESNKISKTPCYNPTFITAAHLNLHEGVHFVNRPTISRINSNMQPSIQIFVHSRLCVYR